MYMYSNVFKETNNTCFRGSIVFQVENTDWRRKDFPLVHIQLKLIHDFNSHYSSQERLRLYKHYPLFRLLFTPTYNMFSATKSKPFLGASG